MEFHIVEKKPGAEGSYKAIGKWFDDLNNSVSDASPLWKNLTPEIEKSVDYEFSSANPNRWKALSPSYRKWKVNKALPPTIGVRYGTLKWAMGKRALRVYAKDRLKWMLNESMSGPKGERVGDYAGDFHFFRPVLGYTRKRIQRWMRKFSKILVEKNTKK
jgi:hypothetical protein